MWFSIFKTVDMRLNVENYKVSYYTTITRTKYGLILFNTYSCGLIKIEEKDIENTTNLDERIIYSLAEKDINYKNTLIHNGFLVKSDIDEFALIKAKYYSGKYQSTTSNITINTGLICNCKCQYCYEGQIHSKISFLNEEVSRDIISFIEKNFSVNTKLNLLFIGGEPLLCINQIKYIYFNLKNKYAYVSFSIVTNGLLLNKENALFLKDVTYENIQISIDGPKYYHNKKRVDENGFGTYDNLISNVKILQSFEMPVSIRTHIDQEFMKEVDVISWVESLKKDFDLSKNIKFYLTPIVYTGKGTKIFDEEYMKYILSVYEIFVENKIPIIFDFMFKPSVFCSVVSQNSFSIDCNGKIYKCWHDLTSPDFNNHQFGDIYNGINQPKLISYINQLDVMEDTECRVCKYLPLCYGGCPEYIYAGYHKCIPLKHYSGQLLSLFMYIKGYAL